MAQMKANGISVDEQKVCVDVGRIAYFCALQLDDFMTLWESLRPSILHSRKRNQKCFLIFRKSISVYKRAQCKFTRVKKLVLYYVLKLKGLGTTFTGEGC